MTNYKITDDLSGIKLGDWIRGVGDINTHFIRHFIIDFSKTNKSDRTKIKDLISGRIEGLKILLKTPENQTMMTNSEVIFAMKELEIVKDCLEAI